MFTQTPRGCGSCAHTHTHTIDIHSDGATAGCVDKIQEYSHGAFRLRAAKEGGMLVVCAGFAISENKHRFLRSSFP